MRMLPVALIAAIAALAAVESQAGGLFSRKHDTAAPPPDAGAQAQNMDCSQLANVQYSGMTVEQCEAMKRMAMGAQGAMNDPAGARPGDQQMSCADIEAEMRTMQVAGVSQQHLKEGKQAAQDFQTTVAKDRAEATAIAARETAEVHAAEAADTATEMATGGLVRGRATGAVQRQIDAEQKVTGERMAKELAPKEQAVFGATVSSGSDLTQSMQSNPRFARLIKLGMDKGCKGRASQ